MSGIHFLGFGRQTSTTPIYSFSSNKSTEETAKLQVTKVLARLKELQLRKQERQRISSEFGVWFCRKDEKHFLYFALCSSDSSERHIYAAIGLLKDHLATIGDYSSEPDSTLKLHAKGKVMEICERYSNLKGVDKLGEANRLLNDIKDDLSDSTRKLIDNQTNLEGLHQKTVSLKQNAQMFETSSATIEREMCFRNCKMTILIIVVVIALICVIVIPIVTTR